MANVTLVRLLPSVNITDVPLEVNLEWSCVAAVLALKGPFSSMDNLMSLKASKLNSPVAAVWPRTFVLGLLLAVLVADVPHHFTLGGELHPTVFTVKGLDTGMRILMVQHGLPTCKAFGAPTAFEPLPHVSPHVLHQGTFRCREVAVFAELFNIKALLI